MLANFLFEAPLSKDVLVELAPQPLLDHYLQGHRHILQHLDDAPRPIKMKRLLSLECGGNIIMWVQTDLHEV